MKRLLDILLSGLALLVLAPLLVPVVILLRLTGEGEIFYRQQRVGKGGELFGLLKFATMLKDSPSSGLLTMHNDPRVLPFGRLLRKTKINELPQLINIFLGDMSIIGPRPQAKPHFVIYPEQVKSELVKIRPGLSGIGSIVFRDEESMLADHSHDFDRFYKGVIAPYKGVLEVWYVQRQSLLLDFLLIGLTVWVILFPTSRAYRQLFPDLPPAPDELIKWV